MNKERLSKKSIYELRILGRKLGVKAPTKLKKQELIYAIIERNLNLVEPYSTTRGRPPLSAPESHKNLLQNEQNLFVLKNELVNKIENVLETAKKEIIKILNDI